MLLVPLFHRVGKGRYSNPPEIFDALFAKLPKGLFPGDTITRGMNYCFTFDDATEDFYQEAYPLLKKHNQRALIAVPTSFIDTPGYCTWSQLLEMEASGHVQCISHTVSHTKLTTPSSEIAESKEILSDRLGREVTAFAYPYGAFTKAVHREASSHYPYVFRIGTACNFSWKGPIYRIPADNLPSPTIRLKSSYVGKFLLHRLRNR